MADGRAWIDQRRPVPPKRLDQQYSVWGPGPCGGSGLRLKHVLLLLVGHRSISLLSHSVKACDGMYMQDIQQAFHSGPLNSKRLS